MWFSLECANYAVKASSLWLAAKVAAPANTATNASQPDSNPSDCHTG
jgi:hypothetical protein